MVNRTAPYTTCIPLGRLVVGLQILYSSHCWPKHNIQHRCPYKGRLYSGANMGCNSPPPPPFLSLSTFSMPQVGLPLASDGLGGEYPLRSAGSTWQFFHLPEVRLHQPVVCVSVPSSLGLSFLNPIFWLLEVSSTWMSFVRLLEISPDDVGQFPLPSVSQDCPDLQSYGYILKLVLDDLGKSDLLVRDIPTL